MVLISTGSGSKISGASRIPSTSRRRMYSGSICSLNLARRSLESFFGSADWSSSTTSRQYVHRNSPVVKSHSWSASRALKAGTACRISLNSLKTLAHHVQLVFGNIHKRLVVYEVVVNLLCLPIQACFHLEAYLDELVIAEDGYSRPQHLALKLDSYNSLNIVKSVELFPRALVEFPPYKVGTIWINSHGVFDAAVPFGGWKQSGLGYFSGKTGLLEYLQREGTPQFTKLATPLDYTQFGNSADTSASVPSSLTPIQMSASPIVDCTYKLYYGGSHKRPDGNTSRTVYNARNQPLALVPEGGKKDVRNAVEAAVKAQPAWWRGGAHLRAQIIYNMAEKLQARRLDFIRHLQMVWNCDTQSADSEVERSLQLLFYWAASCDKPSLGGDSRDMSAMVFQEPLGVMALLVCEGATGLGL
ncbi:unnamed protein product, partial [Timema podura]|nr:unnamed protein product [Timema podura]